MQKYIDIIAKSEIMRDITNEDIASVLKCLNAYTKDYPKSAVIFNEGEQAHFMGMVLNGAVSVSHTDFFGNKNIILKLFSSNVFAETVIFSSDKIVPFSVEAENDSVILCIDSSALTKQYCNKCLYHRQLLDNLFSAIANRNLALTKKISILTQRTTREKVLELLNGYYRAQKSKNIVLDMSRQQMADYLSVERSALSRELSILKQQGIIDYHRNIFRLL